MVRLGTRKINCNLRTDPTKHSRGLAHVLPTDQGRRPHVMYKRETTEYDTEYMAEAQRGPQHHLDFRGFLGSLRHYTALATFPGRSVLSGRFRLRHRLPVDLQPDSTERSETYLRAIFLRRSASVDWSPHRDRHGLEPSIRESADVAVGRIRRDGERPVAKQIPLTCGRINCQTPWRPPASVVLANSWPRDATVLAKLRRITAIWPTSRRSGKYHRKYQTTSRSQQTNYSMVITCGPTGL
jgi:hypothetical protein